MMSLFRLRASCWRDAQPHSNTADNPACNINLDFMLINHVSGFDISSVADSVAASGDLAYVADGRAGLEVIDISEPSSPQKVGGYYANGGAWSVALSGNYAYVLDGFAA